MFRTRAVALILVAGGVIGATPLAAHAITIRISGPSVQLPDHSKLAFPATPTFDAATPLQWTADGAAVLTKVDHLDNYKGEKYVAAWAIFPSAPQDVTTFYLHACAFVAADPDNPATFVESHAIRVGKMPGRTCTFTTSTGPMSVLFVWNGPMLVKLAEQQVGPDVSMAPLFSTYVKKLVLAKLPKPPRTR